jgi:hypothetical protein
MIARFTSPLLESSSSERARAGLFFFFALFFCTAMLSLQHFPASFAKTRGCVVQVICPLAPRTGSYDTQIS